MSEVPEKAQPEIPSRKRQITREEMLEKFGPPKPDNKKVLVGTPSTAAPPHIIERK